DTGDAGVTDAVVAEIRKLSDKPIRFILNTSVDIDHIGGNARLAAGGNSGDAGPVTGSPQGALVIAHEGVLDTLSAPAPGDPEIPVEGWPTEGYPGQSKEVFFNGEGIQLLHQPAAHSGGDSLIFFRRSDVVVTGDI